MPHLKGEVLAPKEIRICAIPRKSGVWKKWGAAKLRKRKRDESEDAAMLAERMETSGPSELEDAWKLMRAKAELDLQMDVYVSGSSNAGRIRGRVSLLTNMFLEFKSLRIDPANLTEWEAALWTRSRVNSGAKSAGSSARTAVSLAEKLSFFF